MVVLFHFNRNSHIVVDDIASALNSKRWQERAAALRLIEEKGLEIGESSSYSGLLSSPRLPVRYWLVRALAVSRRPQTYRDLLFFLKDSNLNIRSMAFSALGRRGDPQAIEAIMNQIRHSPDWYDQWYGYQALKALGWKQTKSN